MAKVRALRRLWRVLEIQEEQAKTALESAVAELRLLERRVDATTERIRSGRQLVVVSVQCGDMADRWAGLLEVRTGIEHFTFLRPYFVEANSVVSARREEYLAKRVDRRQAEILIEEAEKREAVLLGRNNQQGLDEWYLNRLHGRIADEGERRSSECAEPDA